MLRYLTALIAAATVGLAAASAATARPDAVWYWTVGRAQTYVNVTLTVDQDVGLGAASCTGASVRWHGKYRRFGCAAYDDLDRIWSFTLRPVSATRAVVSNIECDDSESDTYCDD
jgi:hypothetical protein